MKKYIVPVLIILFVPVFLGLIKMTSLLLIWLFSTSNYDSIVYGTMIIVIAIGCAVGSYFTIDTFDEQNSRRYLP